MAELEEKAHILDQKENIRIEESKKEEKKIIDSSKELN